MAVSVSNLDAEFGVLPLLAFRDQVQSITGPWTFTSPVTGVTPTVAAHLATKGYVDTNPLFPLKAAAETRNIWTSNRYHEATRSGGRIARRIGEMASSRTLPGRSSATGRPSR